ncbi:MAG: DUF6688 family protein [Limisphaerales bacterium]
MRAFWLIPVGILLALALPAAVKKKSLIWFFAALGLSFAGVMLPLFVFLFSSFMEPEWKGACAYGWLDCFILGKLALTPLVLLATAALYALEIFRVKIRTRRWILVGIFLGAIVASVCFVFGMVCISPDADAPKWWLLVPLYVAVWYSIRAVQLIKTSHFDFWTYFISLVGSLPFWLASWIWSRNLYESLPDKAPSDCFIVTAAGRGHGKFVGPFVEITHNGRRLRANEQLITLWQLENLWQSRAPQSHQSFRRFYNRFGPFVAAQLKSPWMADAAYIAIKPVELAAKFAMQITRRTMSNS